MKGPYTFYIICLLCCFNGLKAQLSPADSAIYYLGQVKALQHSDSVFLSGAADIIISVSLDSAAITKIEKVLSDLIPVIGRQNYLALQRLVTFSSDNPGNQINYGKQIIEEFKNHTGEFEKNLVLNVLADLRLPFRNTNRINEGIEYFQSYANYFEQAGDSAATSMCYYVLRGFYEVLGLTDKAIYCQMKSIGFLNMDKVNRLSNFLYAKADETMWHAMINRKVVLAGMLIDWEQPQKALPYLYESKNLYEKIKNSYLVNDGPNIYLQIIRAKMMTGSDSVEHYFRLMREDLNRINDPDYFANYYQQRSYYFYQQDDLDSAEHYIQQSAALKDSARLMTNSYFGYLVPGYYLSLIKLKQHKYDDAIQLLNSEINELLKVNLRTIVLRELLLLSNAYKLKGDFKNSMNILERYNSLQNQVISEESKSRSVSFETEQNINLLNTQKQQQQHEISRQKFIRNLITGSLVILAVFFIIIFFQRNRISRERTRSDGLLLNILPPETAAELKTKGTSEAKHFEQVTVMFTDFKNFTHASEKLSASELVNEIHNCYSGFDKIISQHNLEKIKTIGDSYMCAGGLPVPNETNAEDTVRAALEIRKFFNEYIQHSSLMGKEGVGLRIGCHTGPVVAGIVGIKKFAYDIWGDTVNIASRMESSGEAGKVNISGSTYELVKDKFNCTHRGKIEAKNKGQIDMYFVEALM